MIDSTVRLGELVRREMLRDAIHIAVIPVVAGALLRPGDSVRREGDTAVLSDPFHRVGVVDPFLTQPVELGQRFWLLIQPGTITSLRHHWTHPKIPSDRPPPPPSILQEAMRWLHTFANDWRIDYEDLLSEAGGGVYIAFGREIHSHEEMPEREEMWNNLEIVLGRDFPRAHREGTSFSCSC